jgi:dTDP-4-amino-4,6-dideoxygalactose transaminase
MTNQKTPLVPMSAPDITDSERQAVMDVLYTPNLSMGAQIDAFEKSIADFSGMKNAIAVNSGTAGLHLCVRAAGIGQNDLVVTTPFSFVASTNVLLFEKAIPVFVDVDPITGNIDPVKAASAVRTLKTGGSVGKRWLPRKGAEHAGSLKGLLAVDVFGQPADYDSLRKIAKEEEICLIEDSCEALGAEYKHRKAGGLGDYGVFAFYPNKQITTGEGGIIVTNDDKKADFMRALRSQGRAPGDTWLQHTYLGYNYRMDEMSAALGRVQMTRIEELLSKRQQVADWYAERLSEIHGIEAPRLVETTTRVSWFVYVIRFDASLNRDKIAAELTSAGIPVRPYFLPIHLQPYLVEQFGYRPGDFPVTEDLGKRGLAIPFSGKMTENQVESVCQALLKCIDHSS